MKLILKTFIFLLLASSSYSQTNEFSKDGIAIKWDDDWAITDKDSLDGAGYYLAIEKAGFDESALITITWVYGETEDTDFLSTLQEGMKDNKNYKNSGLKFSKTYPTTFGNKTCIASSFTCKTLGLKHQGIIYCFRDENKVVGIVKQEALEDAPKNKKGFATISNSFSNQ